MPVSPSIVKYSISMDSAVLFSAVSNGRDGAYFSKRLIKGSYYV